MTITTIGRATSGRPMIRHLLLSAVLAASAGCAQAARSVSAQVVAP